MANRYDNAHLCAEQSKSNKKYLHNPNYSGYIDIALAKSKDRICTLQLPMATHDALCVFFLCQCLRTPIKTVFSMVALAGHPKGWLFSVGGSSANPVNVTAQELCTSRGDCTNYPTEAVL